MTISSNMLALSSHSPHIFWDAAINARLFAAKQNAIESSQELGRLDDELEALRTATQIMQMRRNELAYVTKLPSDVRLLPVSISLSHQCDEPS